jgi:hypothetical protein
VGCAEVLFLSATGLTWSKHAGANIGELQDAIGWSTPVLGSDAHGGHSGGPGHAGHGASDVGIDRVVQAAAGNGLTGPLEIAWPTEPGADYIVQGIDAQIPQRLDQVAVDPATGRVTGELRFADYPVGAKLTSWGIDGQPHPRLRQALRPRHLAARPLGHPRSPGRRYGHRGLLPAPDGHLPCGLPPAGCSARLPQPHQGLDR